MGILNTFFISFKTDATKAKDEVAQLEKQIDSLKAKKGKLSEQEKKDLNDARIQHKEKLAALKEQTNQADDLAESLAKATTALVGFAAVRSGMTNATQFNSDLKVQADLLHQSARALDVYSQAAEASGGSKQGYLSDVSRFENDRIQRGLPTASYDQQYLGGVKKSIEQYPVDSDARRSAISKFGYITDPGIQRALLKGTLDTYVAKADANVGSKSDKDYTSAREVKENVSSIEKNIERIYTLLTTAIGPEAGGLIQSSVGSGIGTLLGIGAGWKAFKFLKGGASLEGGAMAGFGDAGLWGVIAGSVVALGDAAVNGKDSFLTHKGNDLWNWYRKNHPGEYATPASSTSGSANNRTNTALRYFMSKGYSAEQAAGIVANLNAEGMGSGYGKIGDGGRAVGIAQWHPDRVASILKATNIDVRTASLDKQLEAVAWEMQNGRPGFNDKFFRSIKDPKMAGAYVSQKFEGPLDSAGEMMRRGSGALSLMQSTPMSTPGGSATTVNIQKIDVNTQATDANGIAQSISIHLSSALANVANNFDDGRLA